MKRFTLLLLLSILAPNALQAQQTTAPKTTVTLGQSEVGLTGPWKFRIGDDPRWADPSFDDSKWETQDLTPQAGSFDPLSGLSGYVPGWTRKGHPGYWGYAWYRIRVQVDAAPGQILAITGPGNVNDAYQVFANGKLLGSFGKFPTSGDPETYYAQPMMFELPPAKNSGPDEVLLAFRVWMQPNTLVSQPDSGGFHDDPLLGQLGAVTANYQLTKLRVVRTYGYSAVEATLYFLLAILACSLILFDRSDTVYWWLGGVFLLTATNSVFTCLASWTQSLSIFHASMVSNVLLPPLILGGWLMVWWVWFHLQSPEWIPKLIALFTVLYIIFDLFGQDLFYNAISPSLNSAFYLASVGIRIMLLMLLVLIVIWGVQEHGWDGWLTLPAVILVGIAQFQTELVVLHVRLNWFPFGVRFNLNQVANLALLLVLFVLLMRRLLLSLHRQRGLTLDVKHAQEVQQFIIPADPPATPGFAVETIYLPAQEVGGDFFQILPANDGSLLIVVGDVSGKGLKAAMTVSAIVGALRNEKDCRPAKVMANLNNVLRGQVAGFVTATAVLITADGKMTLANAGNLAPYRNGEELTIPSGLPLGIIAENNYPETICQLEPNDRLTFVSDGVIEATNENSQPLRLRAHQGHQRAAGSRNSSSSPGLRPAGRHQRSLHHARTSSDGGPCMKKTLLWLLLALVCACPRLSAQDFNLQTDRETVASLDGLWHFHPGDNPAWASPSFDDSQWPLLQSGKPWNEQGYPGYGGFAWYRFTVQVPDGSRSWSLYLGPTLTAYQAFLDGHPLGSHGRMLSNMLSHPSTPVFIIPPAAPGPRTIHIAVRLRHNPIWASYTPGGFLGSIISETLV